MYILSRNKATITSLTTIVQIKALSTYNVTIALHPDDMDRPYLITPYKEGNTYINAVMVDVSMAYTSQQWPKNKNLVKELLIHFNFQSFNQSNHFY